MKRLYIYNNNKYSLNTYEDEQNLKNIILKKMGNNYTIKKFHSNKKSNPVFYLYCKKCKNKKNIFYKFSVDWLNDLIIYELNIDILYCKCNEKKVIKNKDVKINYDNLKNMDDCLNQIQNLSKIEKEKNNRIKGIKEKIYINYIIKNFKIHNYKKQYMVNREDMHINNNGKWCGGYYLIDLYFPELNLAIECDEYGHKDRSIILENERENFIKNKLGCKFIRFNPDSESFNIDKVINKINNYIFIKESVRE